jgi:hypothetical protein
MKRLFDRYAVICIAAAAVSGTAFASGSVSPSSGSVDLYNTGKTVFVQKVACNDCAFKGRGANAMDAKMLIGELANSSALSAYERDAVVAYLKRRYRIA